MLIWVSKNIHSTKVGLALNVLTASISPKYHVLFDDMFFTVVSSTSIDIGVCIRLVTSRNSSIQVMLYQEDDTELDDNWLTNNERLKTFINARERVVSRIKG